MASMFRPKRVFLTSASLCALAATAHGASASLKSIPSGAQTPVAQLSIPSDTIAVSAKDDVQALLPPSSKASLLPLAKLSKADQNKIAKDENTIRANDKTIAEEAILSGNKDLTLKAKELVADENKRLQSALRNDDGKKVIAIETAVIRQQGSFMTSLLQDDRRNLLEQQNVNDKFAVAVLPELGTLNVLPSSVDNLKFWSSASQSVKTVDFYGEGGEILALDPRSVITSFKVLSELGNDDKDGSETLKAAFNDTDLLVKRFGVAGLFGEMVYLQKFQGETGFNKDLSGLDQAFIDKVSNLAPSASAVPEAPVWSLMILGFGLLGASLRARRMGCAAT